MFVIAKPRVCYHGGPIRSIHTNNAKVIPEDNLNLSEVPDIRSAFPFHKHPETNQDASHINWLPNDYMQASPSQNKDGEHSNDNYEENEDKDNTPDDDNANPDSQQVVDEESGTITNVESSLPPQRSLRSNTTPPEQPFVMEKPIEYRK